MNRSVKIAIVILLYSCTGAWRLFGAEVARETTASTIAFGNLDQQITQSADEAGVEDLLLLRSQFLADYGALDRANALAEPRIGTIHDLLRRARTRAALHRFADALTDISEAERMGASSQQVLPLRASVLIATGHAGEMISQLESNLARRPGFASRSELATAYAAVGRVDEADRLYAAALSDLHTTLPFPYARTWYARGLLWAERGGNPDRAEEMYRQALSYVPEFVAANINLAELEAARGDASAAIARLSCVTQFAEEPEALALLGRLQIRAGKLLEGQSNVARTRQRFEELLRRDKLAFADHAAEFYLGIGDDPERAWRLAEINLANRETERSVALAIKAAEATERYAEACELLRTHGTTVAIYLRSLDRITAR